MDSGFQELDFRFLVSGTSLDSELQSFAAFRIPGFHSPRFLVFQARISRISEIWITLHGTILIMSHCKVHQADDLPLPPLGIHDFSFWGVVLEHPVGVEESLRRRRRRLKERRGIPRQCS